jgi:DNA polymerase-3 subunit gamma/tau
MPDPGELARILREGGAAAPASTPAPVVQDSGKAPLPASPKDMVDMLFQHRKSRIADHLNDCVGIARFSPPELDLLIQRNWQDGDFCKQLAEALREITGVVWRVSQSESQMPSLAEQELQDAAMKIAAIEETPIIKAALTAFPGSELVRSDQPEQWSA